MDIIEKVRICGYSNKFFMELKVSTRSVSVKMYAHQVGIETGRYKKLEDKVRTCLLCNSGEIESEIHFLMHCSYFSDKGDYFSILCKKLFQICQLIMI